MSYVDRLDRMLLDKTRAVETLHAALPPAGTASRCEALSKKLREINGSVRSAVALELNRAFPDYPHYYFEDKRLTHYLDAYVRRSAEGIYPAKDLKALPSVSATLESFHQFHRKPFPEFFRLLGEKEEQASAAARKNGTVAGPSRLPEASRTVEAVVEKHLYAAYERLDRLCHLENSIDKTIAEAIELYAQVHRMQVLSAADASAVPRIGNNLIAAYVQDHASRFVEAWNKAAEATRQAHKALPQAKRDEILPKDLPYDLLTLDKPGWNAQADCRGAFERAGLKHVFQRIESLVDRRFAITGAHRG